MSFTDKQRKLVKWVLSIVGDTAASKAIEALLTLCIQQDEKLEKIARDVSKIKGERYKSGFKYLEDAMNVQSEKLRIDLINDARKAFTQATELEDTPAASRAAYQVGLCYKMLGEPETALRWYERAFSMADAAWESSHNRLYSLIDSGDQSDPRSIGLVLLTLTIVGAPIALHISNRARKEKEQLEAVMREIDHSIPHMIDHLKSLNSKLPELVECPHKRHFHRPQDEYRSFTRSDQSYIGRSH